MVCRGGDRVRRDIYAPHPPDGPEQREAPGPKQRYVPRVLPPRLRQGRHSALRQTFCGGSLHLYVFVLNQNFGCIFGNWAIVNRTVWGVFGKTFSASAAQQSVPSEGIAVSLAPPALSHCAVVEMRGRSRRAVVVPALEGHRRQVGPQQAARLLVPRHLPFGEEGQPRPGCLAAPLRELRVRGALGRRFIRCGFAPFVSKLGRVRSFPLSARLRLPSHHLESSEFRRMVHYFVDACRSGEDRRRNALETVRTRFPCTSWSSSVTTRRSGAPTRKSSRRSGSGAWKRRSARPRASRSTRP